MNEFLLEVALALIGSGILGGLIVHLKNKGKQAQVINTHEENIKLLRNQQDILKDRINRVENNTDVRLTKIETQVTAIQFQILEVSKDVKQILKQNVIKG